MEWNPMKGPMCNDGGLSPVLKDESMADKPLMAPATPSGALKLESI
jgi:hypothetical protein